MATIGTSGWSIRFSPTPGRSTTGANAVRPQLLGRADPRQHQQLRRHQGAGRDDHLAVGEGPVLAASGIAVGDADGAAILQIDPRHRRVEAQRKAAIVGERRNKGIGGAAAPTAPVHELVEADAALRVAVEIGVERLAERLDGLHEPTRYVVDVSRIGDEQRTIDAVPLIVQPVVALHAAKVRQNVGPRPARVIVVAAQQLVPLVVVGRPAAHVDLGVDRRSAAEDVALRNVVNAAAEMFLRHGLVVPHELAAVDHLEDARRHIEQRMSVRMASLQKEHPGVGLDQPRRGHTARRPTADDDVIETCRSCADRVQTLPVELDAVAWPVGSDGAAILEDEAAASGSGPVQSRALRDRSGSGTRPGAGR